ncbi:LAMI_0E01926g1_1 [Lachancea mirantina]|uniref:LAMI_0E01926g1_1 n=1 Tax=Lachancea mirantina TaxID=1230905 RepID=A0A1G4JJ27_9SACH|nr:LAMI_0E01926g1_1 [Lachancea mirantina]
MADLTDFEAKFQVLTQVDGSARFESFGTSVLCSVTGPIEPKARQELPTQLALEIVVRPSKGVPTTREKLLEDKLRGVLTPVLVRYLYPRQLCQICFQILESGENEQFHSVRELSSCINAAFLALADAGVGLQNCFASCCAAVISNADQDVLINPSAEQLRNASSTHVLAFDSENGREPDSHLLLLESSGDFEEETLNKILDAGEKACLQTVQRLRQALKTKVEQDLVWRT